MVQYALGILLAYILFEILIGSSYNTYALLTAIVCSYVLSIGILAIFVARMTTLLASNRKVTIMILFTLALGAITSNMAITLVDVSLEIAR